jgi:hypothetical protein
MGDDKARILFTDPPFNLAIQGHVGGAGRIKHREFAMASGEMSQAQFTALKPDTPALPVDPSGFVRGIRIGS